jgi:hypothetical protein
VPKPLTSHQLSQDIEDCHSDDIEDIVGAAVSINRNGEVKHAALFIRFNEENKVFHYTGEKVLFEDADAVNHHYYKGLLFILPELIPAFMAQCELISERAQPVYGFFYSGSLYDDQGDFIDPGGFPQSMTCVGFCLNVLKHFLGEDNLLHYTDWDSSTVSDGFIHDFFEQVRKIRPALTLEEFKKYVRRILPIEYFTAACTNEVNIRKQYIDANVDKVHQVLIDKRAS